VSARRLLVAATVCVWLSVGILPAQGRGLERPGSAATVGGVVSTVALGAFVLQPAGILVGLHPTAARVTIVATAASLLKVCEWSTSFAGSWKGGCRRLTAQPLALPSSGGGSHIGFRILPWDGKPTRVTGLRLRWHCVDHYFGLVPGRTHVRRVSPAFDC
jgi:hypothetical protein